MYFSYPFSLFSLLWFRSSFPHFTWFKYIIS